ncbi:MAG TPA: L-serine ammonia-lyase, iron-sulfur-dependent, subunit alpha [Patescibacteria group bacterium]|nr:L-serine ammonia-lyase, iron-sulfur-dependent, subunit alpha [Patescibacteria group bacterium]
MVAMQLGKTDFLRILREEVKPATGCTEPAAVAFVAAKAAALAEGTIREIEVTVSKNIYKNAFAVTIPGTNLCGVQMSAAIGARIRQPEKGLEIFDGVDPAIVQAAMALVREKRVQVIIEDQNQFLIRVCIATEQETTVAEVQKSHTNITRLERDGQVLFQAEVENTGSIAELPVDLKECRLEDFLQVVALLQADEISFMYDGIEMNRKIADIGMASIAGLDVGKNYKILMDKGILQNDIVNRTKMMIAAACDARMGGIKVPVMSTTGSGNQGIVAILTVAMVAQSMQTDRVTTCRAVALSHLVAAYVKQNMGKLMPICGCAIAAGIGATAAITWLLGGTQTQIEGAIKNIVGNLMGMICDGAKGGCSLKLATSAGEAITAAYLAMEGSMVSDVEGVVASSLSDMVSNMLQVCNSGMTGVDSALLEIMKEKRIHEVVPA